MTPPAPPTTTTPSMMPPSQRLALVKLVLCGSDDNSETLKKYLPVNLWKRIKATCRPDPELPPLCSLFPIWWKVSFEKHQRDETVFAAFPIHHLIDHIATKYIPLKALLKLI